MLGVYRVLTTLLFLLLYPYAKLRAMSGSRLWQQRLGMGVPERPVDIWLHAASVGEVKVMGNLIDYFHRTKPDMHMLVTTMTATGQAVAKAQFGSIASVCFCPLDVSFIMRRVFERLKPKWVIIAETEIWPSLIQEAARAQSRIVLVNGRMSSGSFRKYSRFAGSLSRLLAHYDMFFLKGAEDAERLAHFGVPAAKLRVAGDMKFDADLTHFTPKEIEAWRARLGLSDDHFLLLAGSTRAGEEAKLLAVFKKVRQTYPQLRLALAPRHLKRLEEIKRLLDSEGIVYNMFDDGQACGAVVLVDRMGVLTSLYSAADLAFVGGTLVDIGGHNILEPVWAGTPVIFGPSLSNVSEAADYITGHNYGAKMCGEKEMTTILEDVISGRRKFAEKTEVDMSTSPTALVGAYIFGRNQDA